MVFTLWFADAFGLWTTSQRPQRVIKASLGLLSVGLNLLQENVPSMENFMGSQKKNAGKSLPLIFSYAADTDLGIFTIVLTSQLLQVTSFPNKTESLKQSGIPG